jgi:hypothetical protein
MTPDIWISLAGVIVSTVIAFAISWLRIGEYKNKVDNLETTIGKYEHNGLRKTVACVFAFLRAVQNP